MSCFKASKISRFWPKYRCIYINQENNKQIHVHAQDHLDFILLSRYGRFGQMFEELKEFYELISDGLDYHCNSEVGYLTVDPFRCGTGTKVSFIISLILNIDLSRDLNTNENLFVSVDYSTPSSTSLNEGTFRAQQFGPDKQTFHKMAQRH